MLHTRGYLNQKKLVLKPTDVISNLRQLDDNGNKCAMTLDDLILRYCYQTGDEIEKDVICNSQYML